MTVTMEDYDQMRRCVATGRQYRSWCEVDLDEVVNLNLEGFLDLVSTRVADSPLLQDISTKVVDFKGTDTLILEVHGDPSAVLAGLEQERWQ